MVDFVCFTLLLLSFCDFVVGSFMVRYCSQHFSLLFSSVSVGIFLCENFSVLLLSESLSSEEKINSVTIQ